MSNKKVLKNIILNHLHAIILDKIEVFTNAIESAKESRNNDTKSSAGDKYETGREMIQIEIDKNTAQLQNARNLKEELARIPIQKEFSKAEFGSLVETNQGIYFLSIGIGKIVIQNKTIFAISTASPIGILLQNKSIHDTFQFQSIEYTIKNIS